VEKPKFQFWFEFASTYSYLAAERIDKLTAAAGIGVEWKPFLLGPIFAAQGWRDSPFNIYPIKGRYMWRDMERWCQKLGLPFTRPSVFPRNQLLAARVACIVAHEPWMPDFVRTVYRANFGEDQAVSQPEVIAKILDDLGQDGPRLIERVGSAENKQRLRAQSDEAIALGVFGAPTFVIGRELFWGNDRLEDAIEWYQHHTGRERT
jgi:2-hydroxychromene-2-carboxylate isomerase